MAFVVVFALDLAENSLLASDLQQLIVFRASVNLFSVSLFIWSLFVDVYLQSINMNVEYECMGFQSNSDLK